MRYRWKIFTNDYDNYQSNNWNVYERTEKKSLTFWDIINAIHKFIEKDNDNIKKILDTLPEDDIQEYLRAKKLSRIKNKVKK